MFISIVLPCYNEAEKLPQSLNKINSYMNTLPNHTYEIIVVNDGSTKYNSQDFINYIKQSQDTKHTKLVSYKKNKGKGYAVKTGIKKAKGDYVIFMDCDLSTNLSAITEVIKYTPQYDIIIGSRKIKGANLTKSQGIFRKFIGYACHLLTMMIIPINVKDTQCGFKAIKSDLAKEIIKRQTINRFAFDVEYLYIAKINNKQIKEFPVIWTNDEDSKVSIISSSIDFFKSLFMIRLNKKHYKF